MRFVLALVSGPNVKRRNVAFKSKPGGQSHSTRGSLKRATTTAQAVASAPKTVPTAPSQSVAVAAVR